MFFPGSAGVPPAKFINAKAQRGMGATKVAQSCTLLYRRFAIGKTSERVKSVAPANAAQNEIPRNSRLKICVTENLRGTRRSWIALQRFYGAKKSSPLRLGVFASLR
jgi:hypothetical protein